VRAIAPIAASGRHSAWCIGWSEAQRLAIQADPRWQGGDYAPGQHPDDGLAAARAMAMVSYRSAGAFGLRHGRAVMDDGSFSAESYLRYQGRKLVGRFDAACYVRITQMMDTHDVSAGRGAYEAVLGRIEQPALCVGVDSDVLYLPEESEELARLIPRGTYREVASPWGHDAFLIEFEQLDRHLRAWMQEVGL
jgi:homoserine O-acetyltransferase/O-succinyltransferase